MQREVTRKEAIVFRVAQLFFEGKKVREIAEVINRELTPEPRLTREGVYPLLSQAKNLGFVKLVPPVELALAQKVAERFNCDPRRLRVVYTEDQRFNSLVADSAADLALGLIRDLGVATGVPIGLGLGPGKATLDFCHRLGHLLESESDLPPLHLHAISAGCPTEQPEFAPASFFNLFPRNVVRKRFGLFAETIVTAREFRDIKKRPVVRDAFEARRQINFVVTSMGDIGDDHDLLRAFLRAAEVDVADLQRRGWIGSVQYRPYSQRGPIDERDDELRAVTLFELPEFVQLAQTKNSHVLLIARQCGVCGTTRARALRPLLECEALRVWSELVMDTATANELLQAAG